MFFPSQHISQVQNQKKKRLVGNSGMELWRGKLEPYGPPLQVSGEATKQWLLT